MNPRLTLLREVEMNGMPDYVSLADDTLVLLSDAEDVPMLEIFDIASLVNGTEVPQEPKLWHIPAWVCYLYSLYLSLTDRECEYSLRIHIIVSTACKSSQKMCS
jgi:hypothetical protein